MIFDEWVMNSSMMSVYRILLRNEPEGGYTAVVPSLPGCVTFGDSMEEAIIMTREAIELYIESLRAHEERISADEI
jgi:antitoxin HicB